MLFCSGRASCQEAIEQYEQALRINPDFPGAHCNLGIALLQTGKIVEAMAQYQQALRSMLITPRPTTTWETPSSKWGSCQDAIEHYEQALRIDPDYAAAHNNFGKGAARIGQTAGSHRAFRAGIADQTSLRRSTQ